MYKTNYESLEKLSKMLKDWALTKKEFDIEKKKILEWWDKQSKSEDEIKKFFNRKFIIWFVVLIIVIILIFIHLKKLSNISKADKIYEQESVNLINSNLTEKQEKLIKSFKDMYESINLGADVSIIDNYLWILTFDTLWRNNEMESDNVLLATSKNIVQNLEWMVDEFEVGNWNVWINYMWYGLAVDDSTNRIIYTCIMNRTTEQVDCKKDVYNKNEVNKIFE